MCVCVCAGCLGTPAEERRIWGAECLLRRKGAALDGGLGSGQVRPECCLRLSTAAGSPQQQRQIQGEPTLKSEKFLQYSTDT